jgi:hypothetical protein
MELSINSLQDAGAFTGAPVEKEIKWEQGCETLTATTYVRKLSYKSAVSDVRQFGGDVIAGRIASCICDKNGNPVFTVDDITGNVADEKGDTKEEKERKAKIRERGPLDHNLTIALLTAIGDVNGTIKKKKT